MGHSDGHCSAGGRVQAGVAQVPLVPGVRVDKRLSRGWEAHEAGVSLVMNIKIWG